MSENIPRIGVATIITHPDWYYGNKTILMGIRRGSHGAGTWSFPGGHLEFNETIFNAAIRETKEETGLDLKYDSLEKLPYSERFFKAHNKHYITLFVMAELECHQEPQLCEPEKCDGWVWVKAMDIVDNKVEPLFEPIDIEIIQYLYSMTA